MTKTDPDRTIGRLAELTGFPPKTIRYYESIGLPPRAGCTERMTSRASRSSRRRSSSVPAKAVETYLRAAKNQHTKMNKCIAIKSFARYLAKKQLWYAGTKEQRNSVLQELEQPKPSSTGMPGYSDDELRGMLRAVDRGSNRLRNTAVLAVELHGFRSKEARLMLKRNVVMAKAHEIQGEFIIDSEARTKKGTGGRAERPDDPSPGGRFSSTSAVSGPTITAAPRTNRCS